MTGNGFASGIDQHWEWHICLRWMQFRCEYYARTASEHILDEICVCQWNCKPSCTCQKDFQMLSWALKIGHVTVLIQCPRWFIETINQPKSILIKYERKLPLKPSCVMPEIFAVNTTFLYGQTGSVVKLLRLIFVKRLGANGIFQTCFEGPTDSWVLLLLKEQLKVIWVKDTTRRSCPSKPGPPRYGIRRFFTMSLQWLPTQLILQGLIGNLWTRFFKQTFFRYTCLRPCLYVLCYSDYLRLPTSM